MVAYLFQKRFAPPILAGTKAQTIRADRKRHARPGELLQLFTGMRTRQCRRLGEARCLEVEGIQIDIPWRAVRLGGVCSRKVCDVDAFAQQDGFRDWPDLVAFWLVEHPGIDLFTDVLIRWEPLVAADPLILAEVA